MVVTIDGPAGAGKSSAARMLADRLGFEFLDTGAMYRTVALAARRRGIDPADEQALRSMTEMIRIELRGEQVFLDGEDVTGELRWSEITAAVKPVADNVAVRRRLSQLQRDFAAGRNIVTEGRDQGTDVFPDAECKFFLTASPEQRARRRHRDLSGRGESLDLPDIRAAQDRRDAEDAARKVGRLRQAADAVVIVTDDTPLEDVVEMLEAIARRRMG